MRYCNHCHKLYDERTGKCPCRKTVRSPYRHSDFYDGKHWRALSNYIRIRDYDMDRLALYFFRNNFFNIGEFRTETPVDAFNRSGVYKLLYDYLIDATGQMRALGGGLVVHHITPRKENYSLQYDPDNLITLNTHTHEYIHQLYDHGKQEEVERLLREAVKANL